MPPRKQIGVPTAAPTRRSSRVAARETASATDSESRPPPPTKSPKASSGRRKVSPRAQAAMEEQVAAAPAASRSKFQSKTFVAPGEEGTKQFSYGEQNFVAGRLITIDNFQFATPLFPSQYPVSGEMKLEIQTKTDYDRHTSLLLFRDYEDSDAFQMPFNNIDQVMVLSELTKAGSAPKKARQYRVLVIPTAATGLSAIKRQYPQIISLSIPNQKVDKELGGVLGKAADPKKDTYLSVFKAAFDKWLQPFDKFVIDATNIKESGIWEGKTTVKYLLKSEPNEKKVPGHAYFLTTGIVFISDNLRFYTPFSSFSQAMLLLAYERNSPVGASYIIQDLTEPYFTDAPGETQDKQSISFSGLPASLVNHLKEWSDNNGIKTMRMNQAFYSYQDNSPMSGFMLPGMMGMM
ncbi:hypothetical protein QBC40DRAFT_251104 [Triangularia verruculosa]|uniref:Uncharacterized protein n=1 Tax=Triangularia verruculosa TaxID=2587418 RepID=A0AAN7AYA2_9PEZI|nr:hypothetical protein QBC40DRAFT_251104 [Triangularia verruculosa]